MTQRTLDRIFAMLIALGLGLEGVQLAAFGPGTFVAFAFLGVPAILIGSGYFATRALRLVLRGDGA